MNVARMRAHDYLGAGEVRSVTNRIALLAIVPMIAFGVLGSVYGGWFPISAGSAAQPVTLVTILTVVWNALHH